MNQKQTVAVLGASPKPQRYSNQAIRLLIKKGHTVIPVHPVLDVIEDTPVIHDLKDIRTPVDTLTVYVGPERSTAMIERIVALNPGRVILNPGTENPALESKLDENNIAYLKACTLVMLHTEQF